MADLPRPPWQSALGSLVREAGLMALRGIAREAITPRVEAFFVDLARALYGEAVQRRGLRTGWDALPTADREEWIAVARDATRVLFERLRQAP